MFNKRPPTITPRRMDFPFDGDIQRHWFSGNAVASIAIDAIDLVFPAGERFFVRSVLHYLDRIEDPVLKERTRGFFAQEALHGREHERAFALLERHGVEVRSWVAWYERLAYGRIERWVPHRISLAVTAALEHLTASLAEEVFRQDYLKYAHPAVADLLKWHAAEEIEHRDVAFDVLRQVDPSWITRATGMAIGLSSLLFFWASARRHLRKQDPDWSPERAKAERAWLLAEGIGGAQQRLMRHALDYLRPGFHPSDRPLDELATAYLASIGRLEA